MLGLLRDKLPTSWHVFFFPVFNTLRGGYERLDRVIDKRKFTESEFTDLLRNLGFTPGAMVMVHSAFSLVKRRVPDITPEKLIRQMQELLGPEGTLLMPTFAFRGRQSHYVDSHMHFDVRTTPSSVGVLTEVFRKMPGVIRSYHPTHSVAGWGRHAKDILSTHHLGSTFGVTSPFYRLREYDGLVVGLGRRYRYAFTITHVPEELNPRSREMAFDPRPRTMTVVDGDVEVPYEFRVLIPGLPREYERISRVMRKHNILRYVTAKGLPCAVTRAEPFLHRAMELADENNYILKAQKTAMTCWMTY
jgi:aminoglycoside N3'-acetyltransferase